MKINLLHSPNNADELYFTGKTTVVIDVLRATSVIIAALNNGAKEIIPVATVEFAMKVSGGMFGGQTLLCGERNTKKVEGFALGNSPLEFTKEIVNGKSLILFTTNGSKAIVKAKFSENQFICAYNNVVTLAEYLVKLDKDFEILCAGKNGVFSMEDTVCGGKLIREIIKLKDENELELSDSCRAAVALDKAFGRSPVKMLRESEHGKLLLENDFEEDIKYCSKLNNINVVPYLSGNVIKLIDEEKNNNKETENNQ